MTDQKRTDPVRVRLSIDGERVDEDDIEIPRDTWDSMDDAERWQFLDNRAEQFLHDYMSAGWRVLSDEGERWASDDDEGD